MLRSQRRTNFILSIERKWVWSKRSFTKKTKKNATAILRESINRQETPSKSNGRLQSAKVREDNLLFNLFPILLSKDMGVGSIYQDWKAGACVRVCGLTSRWGTGAIQQGLFGFFVCVELTSLVCSPKEKCLSGIENIDYKVYNVNETWFETLLFGIKIIIKNEWREAIIFVHQCYCYC